MTIQEARKIKIGDRLRMKDGGWIFVVTGREESARVIYGKINDRGDPIARKHTELNRERT